MFDKSRLQEMLVQYKKDFISVHWPEEKFKWEAVKYFQDNWDIKASDFSEMLNRSLSKTGKLLTFPKKYPVGMIVEFANRAPEDVRAMFIDLYDESKDVYERINNFKVRSSDLLDKYWDNADNHHFQDENAISVYLWLRYPDKYYIYKYGEVKRASEKLGSNYQFKKGAYAENIRNFYNFYNEICAALKQDKELISLLNEQLTDSCYPDPELRTLTADIGFYISRRSSGAGPTNSAENGWFPSLEEYDPEITAQQWVSLLKDSTVFTQSSLEIVKRFKDYGGSASCSQIAEKYGERAEFYSSGSVALAKRVFKKTDCPVMGNGTDNSKWWPILFVGRPATMDEEGTYVWKLRDELSEALDEVDLSHVDLYAQTGDHITHGYWWLNANPKIWSFSNVGVGEVQDYTLYNENGNKRRVFSHFLEAKAGDLVIGYETNPVKQVVALAKISRSNDGEKIYFEKTESLANPIDFQTLKESPELQNMEFFQNPNGSFFKLTKGEYEFILDLIRDENPLITVSKFPPYTKTDFLSQVYMSEEKYDRIRGVFEQKTNIILQGAPGVGKTFAAKRLAYSIMGAENDDRIEMVQFHQNYSYEDFVMGYKPSENGFELKPGVFYRFCKKAENQPNKNYFFIIDEINRGNISKIFGELLMLIEKDHRDEKITLAYNGMPFSVPGNLYIIGMMNTADRSLALIDYALRRRFSFIDLEPAFESQGFLNYQETLENETFDELIQKIIELNKEIRQDKSLGKGFCIGHSYFCGQKKENCTDAWMQNIVDFDILPMLSEYWFDDEAKVQRWTNILHGVFQ